ncbi:MAG TPA: response regulator, partial [Candidatus Cloacimonadota bacterium]|nr:response regulator [Candidatus Cloacimonadota bacterium]
MLIQQWITAPLSLISHSLKENDPNIIKPITTKNNEFADVALLIERFFAQKQELLLEIEERRNAELKLREIEEQTRKILITSPESIIVTDLEGRILTVNEETLRLLEIESETILTATGVNISGFVIKHDQNLFTRMLNELCTGFYIKNLEITIDNGKGLRFPALMSASVILDENRKPSKYIFITRDLTDLKNLELQLRQSQKLESIGTLAGGIAHDFNNIITIIAGYIALASGKAEPNPEVIDDLDEGLKACLRAKSLIGKILTFSRQSDLAVEEIILADIIQESLPMIRASIPSKVLIETDIQSYRYTLADATEMQQVLINLATNAYHAMRPDGGVLGISLREVESSELLGIDPHISLECAYLHLAVSDTGCGMSKEMITRIFDPYFSTKDVGEGSGLGLSIVHGIVNGYKGFISVDSTLGEGSTFNIYLPVAEVQAAKPQEPKIYEYPLIPAQILMVDDEPALAEIFCQSLTNSGYNVSAYHDSNLALQDFCAQPDEFDLVIADITMPGLDGIELAIRIKAIRNLPIILYTGFLDHGIQSRTEQAGIKHVLNKPILPNELLNHVKEVLYLHRQRQA